MTRPLTLKPSLVIASLVALGATVGVGCRAEPPTRSSQIETSESTSPTPPGSSATTVGEAHDGADNTPHDGPTDAGAVTHAADAGEASSASDAAEAADAERTAASSGVPDEATVSLSRGALERAYIDIYCAQRRGETARLQAIYAEHGFSDPREWRRTWIDATRDHEWLATITRAAIEACP